MTTSEIMAEMVEIQECRRTWDVNHYLSHGYRLLSVMTVDIEVTHDERVFNRRVPRFIVGRTADVAPTPQPWRDEKKGGLE